MSFASLLEIQGIIFTGFNPDDCMRHRNIAMGRRMHPIEGRGGVEPRVGEFSKKLLAVDSSTPISIGEKI